MRVSRVGWARAAPIFAMIFLFIFYNNNNLLTSCLFVSSIIRFRQEYRLERKLLTELSVDPDSFPVDNEDLSQFVAATSSCSSNSRHRISRVVVLHNEKLETFFNPNPLETVSPVTPEPSGDDFFDNDSFWSGQITWY